MSVLSFEFAYFIVKALNSPLCDQAGIDGCNSEAILPMCSKSKLWKFLVFKNESPAAQPLSTPQHAAPDFYRTVVWS